MREIRIGGGSEYVLLRIPTHEISDGWYEVEVSVAVPGFVGSVRACLEPVDFKLFEQQLQVLYETLQGTAALRPIEKQVEVMLVCNSLGGISVTGQVSSMGSENKLQYSFEIDQTFLVEPLVQLGKLNGER